MRHHVDGRKLGRTTAHRTAMLANMAASLAIHEKIETTLPRAKELRSIADRLVKLGKRGTLAARRRAIQLVRDRAAVKHAFSELAVRFKDRNGGYTRVMKLGFRHGDSAPMAIIEYLPAERHAHAEGEQHAAAKKPAAKKHAAPKKAAAPKARIAKSERPASKRAAKAGSVKAAPKIKKSGRGD
jgi:large subunit ribosomal protein L17